MRGLGGFVLLAGIGVGLFVYLPAPVDRSTNLEQATRALATRADESVVQRTPAPPPAASSSPSAPSRLASFSPGVPLTDARRPRQAAAPIAPPAANLVTTANWQTTVAPTSGNLEPTDADSRYKLVVDIQQQLKRVGCYWGRASGSWNAGTREAMREFTTRSNAALPVDKPDYLLLTLLKSHNGRSCGAPESTVASAAASTVATTAPAEVLPWKANAAGQPKASRLYTPVPTSVVTTEPLPGRMAIGAPLPPTTQEPLIAAIPPAQQPGTAGAAPDAGAASRAGAPQHPAVSTRSRPSPGPSKKAGASHRATPGTPRYNLMLSLGGVY